VTVGGGPQPAAIAANGTLVSRPPVHAVFCVPGRNETYAEAFGMVRWPAAGVQISGLDWHRDLAQLDLAGQVELVARKARPYWRRDGTLAGRSYGAWILLNTLVQEGTAYPGTVVCIASVLGYGQSGRLGLIAPRARSFWNAAKHKATSPARELILVHAEDDDQCQIDLARSLSALWEHSSLRTPAAVTTWGSRSSRMVLSPYGGGGTARATHLTDRTCSPPAVHPSLEASHPSPRAGRWRAARRTPASGL